MDRIRLMWALGLLTTSWSASVRADPASVLERKGLVRGPSGYVLPAESDARSKLVALRKRTGDWNSAAFQLGTIRQQIATIPELNQQLTEGNWMISNLNSQMGRFPGTFRGGRVVHGVSMQDESQFQALRASRDQLDLESKRIVYARDTLRNQGLERQRVQAQEQYDQKGAAARDALREMREAVDAASRSYDELANDPEVARSLEALGRVKLGPSPEFVAAARELAQFERTAGQTPGAIPGSKPAAPVTMGTSKPIDRAAGRLKAAMQTEKNGKAGPAREAYEALIKDFPDTEPAAKAAERIQFLKGR